MTKHVLRLEEDRDEFEQIENTLLCAKWLVKQFEDLKLITVARLFQNAIDDSEAWIHTMISQEKWSKQHADKIREQEAKSIHNILIKYASINDVQIREELLNEMLRITNKKQN